MISEKIGILLKKNTKTKIWWAKLVIALVLSNIFFFILFSGGETSHPVEKGIPEGWVEVQLEAELLTPFHLGKKVLIVHRSGRIKLQGVLQGRGSDESGRITVLVKEEEAHELFHHDAWEVLPYLKHLTFAAVKKGTSHEIRY